MLLAIKIGNTNVGLALYDGGAWQHVWRTQTRIESTTDEYGTLLLEFLEAARIERTAIRDAILVSVVPPLTQTLEEVCRRYLRLDPYVAGPDCRLGMRIVYDNPRALGTDRMVTAVGAKDRYGAPVIVVDFGTATTFNVVNRAGDFAGGAITPGLNLTVEALHRYTAQLPRVEVRLPARVIATNTVQAIRSGVVYGYAALVQGMVERIRVEMGEPEVPAIATGGLAALIAPHVPLIRAVDPDLTYHGLRLIYQLNAQART